jgi:phospholipid/cholesterol/gamma-HCH transport system substrate-binding protein
MGRNAIETVLGAVVLVVAGLFMVFAYSSADLQKVQGYIVTAKYSMVDGIKAGTDVKINGVKIGSVSDLSLVTTPGVDEYKVKVRMTILPSVRLPEDTVAMIASESLLGGKYVSLVVGVDEEMIKTDGTGRINNTQPPMRLDDLIGQLIYSSKKSDSGSNNAAPAPAPAASPAPAVAPAPTKVPAKASAPVAVPVPAPVQAPAPIPAPAPSVPSEPAHP